MFENIEDFLVGRITFPLTNYLLNRRNIISTYKKLLKYEKCSEEHIQKLQLKKLKDIISHAGKYSPYYSHLFKEIGLNPEDIKTLEDIKSIPPLSRQDVIDQHKDMVDYRLKESIDVANASKRGPGVPVSYARFRTHKLVRNTSSGSTGAPTIFYDDGSATAINWALELRLRHWYGNEPGVREARMARFSTDYMPSDKVIRMRKLLWHQLMLPGINLEEKDYAYCLERIKEFKPKVLWGFTSALTGLAEFIMATKQDISSFRPNLIITWAAPMYEHEEKALREGFECNVTNIYGAREVGHIAFLCSHHSLHINREYLIVETENDSEEASEILVTTLWPSVMPFIRYRMGDLGVIAKSDCQCGLPLPVIKNFLGRTGEIFITRDGKMIAPNFWCRTFMDEERSRSIERFQVIYTKEKDLRIKIVINQNFTDKIESDLRKFLEKNFHKDTKIDFIYVDKIDPQISGKYQMVVKE